MLPPSTIFVASLEMTPLYNQLHTPRAARRTGYGSAFAKASCSCAPVKRDIRKVAHYANQFSYRRGVERAICIRPATMTSAPPRKEGVALLLTGLPAAGKTTLARALALELRDDYRREVTVLDGDEMRRLFAGELGYSREHRRLNVMRHAFIATELCRHGALVICAIIAPYDADRAEMRRAVSARGRFVEIHLSTALAVCEQRDPKGLYARARAGTLEHMTGIDDPYEAPEHPELTIDAGSLSVSECVSRIVTYLQDTGALPTAATNQ